uniref:DEP domain-containing protein n=1 Tax=Anser brachyrhynchus TaxID=132585 RepID=A0A8B9C142_9AVES
MAGGSVRMPPPPPCEAAEPARGWRSPGGGAPDPPPPPPPVQLRQKLRELPALLRSGLTLRRKSAAAAGHRTLSRRISNPYLETPSNKIYGESSSCAGRALRNIFTLQASDLIKDRVYLTGICRRSCVGSELVDWLLEHCPFVKCRSTAVGVWQLLLDMGIILSVDRQLYFQDAHAFYQFSADECTYLFCEFEKEEGWKNGVKLLLQLLPLAPPRIDMCSLPDQKIEDTAETNAEILARLTSAVQRELAAVIALKARKSAIHQNEENNSQEKRGLEDLKDTSDAQAGVLCKLQERDDIGRIELVQKLARENCQFLQADRKQPEKAEQAAKRSLLACSPQDPHFSASISALKLSPAFPPGELKLRFHGWSAFLKGLPFAL